MIVNFSKHRGLGSTGEITFDNYKSYINKIGISKLPPALLKGHQFLSKNADSYSKKESITETIDDFLNDLNKYVSKLSAAQRDKIFKEDNGYSGNKFTGKNYKRTKDLPLREIAKLVKKELEIEYEGVAKFSVTTDIFSGGQALGVDIVDITFNPYTDDFLQALKAGKSIEAYQQENNDQWNRQKERFNEEFKAFIKKVETIANQYNFDDSDSQTDYYHVAYYDRVGFNESKYLVKYFPNSPDAQRHINFNKHWDEAKKKSSAKAAERKGKYKKGTLVFYSADMHESWHKYKLPNGFYLAEILKSPNGRSIYSAYTLRILQNIKEFKQSTLDYHKSKGLDKYYIKTDFGTFYSGSTINAQEQNMFPLNADEKILAIQKAKLQAIKLLRTK